MSASLLESRLRHEFSDTRLLRQALTHRSFSHTHNERLEYLGDSVLSCAVATLLYERFPQFNEGDLSRMRSNLVKQQSLYEIAMALGLPDWLRLGESELAGGGLHRPSILADAFEALLGAILLDAGYDAAAQVVRRIYLPILQNIDLRMLGKDPKTKLQEHLQGNRIPVPTYTIVEVRGPRNEQVFEVECAIPQLSIHIKGTGSSRRAAEQDAAGKVLKDFVGQKAA